jgi:hypothetical protein
MVLGLVMAYPPQKMVWGLVETLGTDSIPSHMEAVDEVRIIAVQHAGVFDSTVVHSSNPRALIEWLEKNGYKPSGSADEAVADYVKRKWVFVASKVRCDATASQIAALHPLAFTFLSKTPVYPMRLTAVDNDSCTVDLYVFGDRRASAPYFHAERCDRVAGNWKPGEDKFRTWLRISDPLIGSSSVGTKLNGTLTSRQMRHDAEIKWEGYGTKGAYVFSYSSAATFAVNIAIPFAVLAWLAMGASRDGWGVNEKYIKRWRIRLVAVAAVLAFAIFFLLPKVDIVAN